MTGVADDRQAMLRRLETALAAPGIPPKAVAACRSLIAQLARPVRVGLFGIPGAGKVWALNALAGETIVPAGLDLPSLELKWGDENRTTVTCEDGNRISRPGLPDDDIPGHSPVFIQVEAPLDVLRALSVLNLVTEAEGREMSMALNWAASRTDISIWCTRYWSTFERTIWRRAPETLRNHALLAVLAEGARPVPDIRPDFEDGFEKLCPVSQQAGGVPTLRNALVRVIEDALAEDVDSALAFLQRIDSFAPEAVAEARPVSQPRPAEPPPDPVAVAPSRPRPSRPPKDENAVSPEAFAGLSRAFLFLRGEAAAMLRDLPAAPLDEEASEALLERMEAAFEGLADLADREDAFADRWPGLHSAVTEAQELALLMRIEGGAEQAAEAATLMRQLRCEFECALAA